MTGIKKAGPVVGTGLTCNGTDSISQIGKQSQGAVSPGTRRDSERGLLTSNWGSLHEAKMGRATKSLFAHDSHVRLHDCLSRELCVRVIVAVLC